jgi:hypothetical protein
LAGGLKVVYDLWIFAVFRNVKPPEENRIGISPAKAQRSQRKESS